MSGGGGVWQLAETIAAGKSLGLTALQTIFGSPLPKPPDMYRLVATASPSYVMLLTAGFCVLIMLFIRTDARRYRVFLKLSSAKVEGG
jgi:hypothetical protein